MNVDIGGSKGRRTLKGKWKILDKKSGDFKCDLNSSKLPFEANTVNAFYCSHTLEHIEPERIPKVLKQMFKALKPGGMVRIVVPDCQKAVKWYLNKPAMLQKPGAPTKPEFVPETRMGFLNCWFYTHGRGHRSGFDTELLNVYIKNAGFKKIRWMKYNDCSKIFVGKDYARYEWFSIYCEATK